MRETDFIGGFAKGLKVIEAFGEAKPRLTITDISKETGLDRATARRCLLTLAELGYAAYDGKFFELTPKILRLGYAYLSATPLPRPSRLGCWRPYIEDSDLTPRTCFDCWRNSSTPSKKVTSR